jgi:hypothetical protein
VIENSYGRVSLLPQPVVLPTLYMPKEVAAGLNSFTYSESLVQQHLRSLGYDMYRDFHTIVVSEAASTNPMLSCRTAAAAAHAPQAAQGMCGWQIERPSVSTGLLASCCCASPVLPAGAVSSTTVHQPRQHCVVQWRRVPHDLHHALQPPALLPPA